MTSDVKEPGSYHKLWFAISIGLNRALDYIAVSSLVSGILALLLGSQYYVIFFATTVIAFAIRLAITAFNWKSARFLPMDTEYRVTVLEDRVSDLERLGNLRGVNHAQGH